MTVVSMLMNNFQLEFFENIIIINLPYWKCVGVRLG